MKQPVLLDPALMRPRMDADPCPCAHCARKSARWLWLKRTDEGASLWLTTCSLCWFYTTPWGTENAEGLAELIAATEQRMGRQFARTTDGKLLEAADADRILSAVSITSRIFKAAERK